LSFTPSTHTLSPTLALTLFILHTYVQRVTLSHIQVPAQTHSYLNSWQPSHEHIQIQIHANTHAHIDNTYKHMRPSSKHAKPERTRRLRIDSVQQLYNVQQKNNGVGKVNRFRVAPQQVIWFCECSV
jgi:hypothetical protein